MANTKTKAQAIADVSLDDLNTRFGYVLATRNDTRGRVFDPIDNSRVPEREYKPRQNVLTRSSIIWDGSDCVWEGTGPSKKLVSGHKPGKYIIRYYDGCTSLFEDEQPKDKAQIDQLLNSTRELLFLDGYLYVYGYDAMLKKYLDICSWNGESPYRVPTVDAIFVPLDVEASAEKESDNLDKVEEALELAKKADHKKMLIHASFLGVAMIDTKTSNPLSDKAIRTGYRKAAMEAPLRFIATYNDKSMQVSGWIEKAVQTGEISFEVIANQAVWAKKGVVICDISGLKSAETRLNKLIEHAKSEAGADFLSQLTALYN